MNKYELYAKENDNKSNPLGVSVIEHGKPNTPLQDIELNKSASHKKYIPAELLSVKEHKAIEDYNKGIGEATEAIKATVKKMQRLHAAQSEVIAEKYKSLVVEMEQIQNEIAEIKSQPLIRDDVIRLSIQNLVSIREEIKREFLKDHFELIKDSGPVIAPFSTDAVQRLLDFTDAWRISYFIITEEDITAYGENISNEGDSLVEREKKVNALEKKFNKIRDQIVKEAKESALPE